MTPATSLRSKFSSLPVALQVFVVVLVVAVLGVSAGAFIYSYNALYAVGARLGGVKRVAWIWPCLIDGQIIAANVGLAYDAALDKPRGWMRFWVVAALTASVGFNVWHAGHNRALWLVAAVAPLTIEGVCAVGVHVLDATMHALGRPTKWTLPERQIGVLGPSQTTVVQLPDGTYGMPGGPFPGYGAGTFPPQGPYGQMPSTPQQQTPQLGHAEIPEATKRQAVEMYLSGLPPEQAGAATRSSVAAALNAIGVPIDETYAGRILGEWRVAHPANNRGSGNGTKPPRRSLRKQQG